MVIAITRQSPNFLSNGKRRFAPSGAGMNEWTNSIRLGYVPQARVYFCPTLYHSAPSLDRTPPSEPAWTQRHTSERRTDHLGPPRSLTHLPSMRARVAADHLDPRHRVHARVARAARGDSMPASRPANGEASGPVRRAPVRSTLSMEAVCKVVRQPLRLQDEAFGARRSRSATTRSKRKSRRGAQESFLRWHSATELPL